MKSWQTATTLYPDLRPPRVGRHFGAPSHGRLDIGVGRVGFTVAMGLLVVALVIVMATLGGLVVGKNGGKMVLLGSAVGPAGVLTIGVALLALEFWVAVKRVRSIGVSGWWALLQFVPGLGPFVFLSFFVLPPGYVHVRKLDNTSWLVLTVMVLVLGAVVALSVHFAAWIRALFPTG